MPKKKRSSSAKKSPAAKKAVRTPLFALHLLLPLRQQSSLRGCARAPQKASADNPLAGSAEWDPDTVTPAETNLGVKLTGQVGAKPQRWLLRLLRSSAWR